MLREILESLMMTNPARKIGGAGKMNPNNTKIGKALPEALPMRPMKAMSVKEKQPDFIGELPKFRVGDGALGRGKGMMAYNREDAQNMQLEPDFRIDRALGARTGNPMGFNQGVNQEVYPSLGIRTRNPMNFDTIPNNFTGGRTGYYQGSNPYLNNLDDFDYPLRVR